MAEQPEFSFEVDLGNVTMVPDRGLKVKKILVISNDWPLKMPSGTNYRTLKVVQYWKDAVVDILLPRLGFTYAQQHLRVTGKVIITDSFFEREMPNIFGDILLKFSRMLRALLSPPQEEYDAVVASSHYLPDLLPAAYVRSKNPGCKLVAYYHAALVSEKNILMSFLRKINDAVSIPLLRKHTDLILTVNQPVKDFLTARGVKEAQIKITNNGLDEIASDTNPHVPVYEACFVGRLVRSKGVFDLVAIWKGVSADISNAKLMIIGEGPEKGRLLKLIEKEDLGANIIINGFVDEQRKFEIMRKSALLILPSYYESWGIVIAEAQNLGLPVITYDLPAMKSVWGNDIICISEGDTRAFGTAVIELLGDSQLRSELSRRGRQRSRQYLWSNIAALEAEAIESL